MKRDPALVQILVRFARLRPAAREHLLGTLSTAMQRTLLECWEADTHDGQFAPGDDWRVWAIIAGRGFGKTRAGAEWVSALARSDPAKRIALVGHTLEEVRQVMVEGPAGIVAVRRHDECPRWSVRLRGVQFSNGAIAYAYSAENPEKLRGPEHHAAWCDELAKWRLGERTWDNLMMTIRIGDRPQVLVTTTPKPGPLLTRVLAMPGTVVTRGSSRANPHLPPAFLAAMLADYGGTRLGRQEIDGELLEDVEGALWTRKMIEDCRVKRTPHWLRANLVRVVVGVDPPATAGGDACGIVAAGLGRDGKAYVLEDASVAGLSPDGWARAVAKVARRWRAERIVAERNMGGDMVASVLAGADRALPVKLVVASRGKVARAEPVSAKYEQGEVKHAGAFEALEDELAGLQIGGGYQGPGRSPDRADACVWALTELLLRRPRAARVRGLA